MREGAPLRSRLASLLEPIERERFFAEHWDRRSLYVPGTPEKLASIHFGLEDFFSLMRDVPKGGPPEIKVSYVDTRRDHQEMPIRPDEARELFEAGLTVCAARLHRLVPGLSRLAIRLIEELRREIAINCYVSPDGKGFGIHFDDHGVMILQLSGRKRWRHGSAPCARFPRVNFIPLRSQTRIPDDLDAIDPVIPSLDDLECSLLSPGDVLYLPPATWHQAKAEGHSVALTISFAGPDGRDVVREVMESLVPVEGLPQFTPAVPLGLDESARREELRSQFTTWVERYKAAAEALDVEEVLAAWSDKLHVPSFHIDRVGKEGLFQELQLDLQRGAKIGLIGARGSGKSTLLRILAGLDREHSGKVHAEPDVRVGYLSGRGSTSLSPTRAFEPFEERDEAGRTERRREVEAALSSTRSPRREELCRLLVDEPELLLLDDPTDGLDAGEAGWLEKYLARYPGTVVAASRDRRFLDRFAGWILELSDGRGTPWQGNYSSWVEQKLERTPEASLAGELEWIRRGDGKSLPVVEGVSLSTLESKLREIDDRSRLGVLASKEAGARLIRVLTGEEAPDEASVRLSGNVRVARSFDEIVRPEDGDLVLVDESSLDLDVETKRRLEASLTGMDAAAVIVSDDRWLLSRVATEVIALEGS